MKLREDLTIRSIAGESVIIMPHEDTADFTSLINLNSTARAIWDNFAGKDFEKADIVKFLLDTYEIEEEIAVKDTDVFVNQLMQINALEC